MIDNTGVIDVAVAWVETLRARGVTVTLRGNRLELRPANAYKALSDAELLTLRHHREAIKKVVRAGPPVQAASESVAPTLAPTQCQWCHQTPCVGRDHHGYDALHAQDPEHVAARDERATAEMFESLRRARTGGFPRW